MIRTKRIYARNGKLYIDSYTEYGRVRVATGLEDTRANRGIVNEKIEQLIYKVLRGEKRANSSMLKDIIDGFFSELVGVKQSSLIAYKSMARQILSALGNKDIRLFSAVNVGAWFASKPRKFESFFNRLIGYANEKNTELNLKPIKIKRARVLEDKEATEPFSLEEMKLILSTLRLKCTQSDLNELESGEGLAHRSYQKEHRDFAMDFGVVQVGGEEATLSVVPEDDKQTHQKTRKSTSGQETSQDLLTYLYIAFLTGARTGEILALTWSDIDFENSKIAITKSLNESGEITSPKTKSSVRHIDMLEPLREYLLSARHSVLSDKSGSLALGGGHYPQGNSLASSPHNPDFSSQSLECQESKAESSTISDSKKSIVTTKRADLRAQFYALLDFLGIQNRVMYNTRHSFASIMLSQGEEPLWVAAMLGHKNLNITYSHYAKFIPQKTRARATFLNGLLESKVTNDITDSKIPELAKQWTESGEVSEMNFVGYQSAGSYLSGNDQAERADSRESRSETSQANKKER